MINETNKEVYYARCLLKRLKEEEKIGYGQYTNYALLCYAKSYLTEQVKYGIKSVLNKK